MRITEVLDKPAQFKLVNQDDDLYVYQAMLNDKQLNVVMKYDVNDVVEDETWRIDFSVDGSQEMTGGGNEFSIIATVLAIVDDFMKKEQPEIVTFAAKQDHKGRVSLYNKLSKALAGRYGFKTRNKRIGGEIEYIFMPRKQKTSNT